MSREDAIGIAREHVARNYPMVPPVAQAFVVPEHGEWAVGFLCSWDTDDLAMPQRLILAIRADDGHVRVS